MSSANAAPKWDKALDLLSEVCGEGEEIVVIRRLAPYPKSVGGVGGVPEAAWRAVFMAGVEAGGDNYGEGPRDVEAAFRNALGAVAREMLQSDPTLAVERSAEDAEAIAYVSGVRDAAIDHDVEEAEALTRVLRLARAAAHGDEGYRGPGGEG